MSPQASAYGTSLPPKGASAFLGAARQKADVNR